MDTVQKFALSVIRANGDVEILQHIYESEDEAREHGEHLGGMWQMVHLEIVPLTIPTRGVKVKQDPEACLRAHGLIPKAQPQQTPTLF